MRRILTACVVGLALTIAVGGCRPAEEKPLPPPNPNGQPQAEQPAVSTPVNPTPDTQPANR
jgi:hypothetical protein